MDCTGELASEIVLPLSLYYRKAGHGERLLPPCATGLQRIGAIAATNDTPGRRNVVAIAVPTRSYAAIFVAMGAILGRSHLPVMVNDLEGHFARLCKLPLGTKVWVTEGNKRHRGVVLGTHHIEGQPFVKIQLATSDGLAKYIGTTIAATVEVDQWDGALPLLEKGKQIVRRVGFLEAAFSNREPQDFGARSRMDAVIVGGVARLRAEIMDTPIGARLSNGRFIFGGFQDLLRVRRLAPTQAFRSELISGIAPDFDSLQLKDNPTVIFDGARPFIKCRDAVPSSRQIVVLDRTSHGFQDAVDILNQQYLNRSDDIPAFRHSPDLPWGVELMAFAERAR